MIFVLIHSLNRTIGFLCDLSIIRCSELILGILHESGKSFRIHYALQKFTDCFARHFAVFVKTVLIGSQTQYFGHFGCREAIKSPNIAYLIRKWDSVFRPILIINLVDIQCIEFGRRKLLSRIGTYIVMSDISELFFAINQLARFLHQTHFSSGKWTFHTLTS